MCRGRLSVFCGAYRDTGNGYRASDAPLLPPLSLRLSLVPAVVRVAAAFSPTRVLGCGDAPPYVFLPAKGC